jgi:hypothetical protein
MKGARSSLNPGLFCNRSIASFAASSLRYTPMNRSPLASSLAFPSNHSSHTTSPILHFCRGMAERIPAKWGASQLSQNPVFLEGRANAQQADAVLVSK